MEFDMKHVINAIILAVLYAVLAWLFAMIKVGIVWEILATAVLYGGLVYFFKDVKGMMNGLFVGIIYVVIFFGVAMLVKAIGWNAAAIYPLSAEWKDFFMWPGIWVPTLAHLLFMMVIGWVNDQK